MLQDSSAGVEPSQQLGGLTRAPTNNNKRAQPSIEVMHHTTQIECELKLQKSVMRLYTRSVACGSYLHSIKRAPVAGAAIQAAVIL